MIFGMSLAAYTTLHTILSLIGIAAGLIALFGMLGGRLLEGLDLAFPVHDGSDECYRLWLSGYGHHALAYCWRDFASGARDRALCAIWQTPFGAWRWIYAVTAVMALYLNSFVGVVQAFLKIPALNALAPAQTEPPFQIAQLLTFLIFLVCGFLAIRKFHPERGFA